MRQHETARDRRGASSGRRHVDVGTCARRSRREEDVPTHNRRPDGGYEGGSDGGCEGSRPSRSRACRPGRAYISPSHPPRHRPSANRHRRASTHIETSTKEGIAAHTVAKLYGSGMVRQVRQVRLLPTSSGTRLGRFSMSRRRRGGSRVRRETSVDTPPIHRPHSTRVFAWQRLNTRVGHVFLPQSESINRRSVEGVSSRGEKGDREE